MENGRIRIGSGTDQTYPISGNRDQLPFTFCPPGDNGRCRTWLVHKFTVQCGGGRVMWNEIVAAAAGRVNGRASIENGQLLWQVSARPQVRYVALPRGYAPLSVIGARILVDDEVLAKPAPMPARLPQAEVSLPTVPPLVPVVSAPANEPPVKKQAEKEVVAPLPAQVTVIAEDAPPPTFLRPVEREAHTREPLVIAQPASWRSFVETAGAAAAATRDDGTILERNTSFGALLIVATVLLLLSAIFVPRRKVSVATPDGLSGGAQLVGEGERALVLRTKAEGQLVTITDALDRLAAVAPLRNALNRDLMASERRLAVVIAAISTSVVDAADWTRARRRLERINHDLDRLQMICEGAVTSLSGLRPAGAVPTTRDEAFAVLGVAPGVGEPILKKLVEALRVSWHPDLARSDADREARTARMTEINVAWDLITGKRHG